MTLPDAEFVSSVAERLRVVVDDSTAVLVVVSAAVVSVVIVVVVDSTGLVSTGAVDPGDVVAGPLFFAVVGVRPVLDPPTTDGAVVAVCPVPVWPGPVDPPGFDGASGGIVTGAPAPVLNVMEVKRSLVALALPWAPIV